MGRDHRELAYLGQRGPLNIVIKLSLYFVWPPLIKSKIRHKQLSSLVRFRRQQFLSLRYFVYLFYLFI